MTAQIVYPAEMNADVTMLNWVCFHEMAASGDTATYR